MTNELQIKIISVMKQRKDIRLKPFISIARLISRVFSQQKDIKTLNILTKHLNIFIIQ